MCDGGHVHRGRGLERDQQQARRIERAREERREKGLALPRVPERELPGAHARREVRVVGKELERQVAAGEVDDVMDAPVHAEEPVEEQRQRGAGEAEDVAPGLREAGGRPDGGPVGALAPIAPAVGAERGLVLAVHLTPEDRFRGGRSTCALDGSRGCPVDRLRRARCRG